VIRLEPSVEPGEVPLAFRLANLARSRLGKCDGERGVLDDEGCSFVDRGFEFTKDTIAAINTSGLLGEVYISLDAGGDTTMLKDGERIPKTQSAVVMEKLISQFLFDKAAESGNAKK